ncbi:MAG TPA: hypothetical protein ENH06_00845 [bacterium]|nr:hypothetical protein [bacterium]
MIELIAIIILFASIFGMTIILFRKLPVLEGISSSEISQESLSFEIRQKVLNLFTSFFSKLSIEKTLHKLLLKFRILVLKTENKTSKALENLKKKEIEKEEKDNDDYWNELKKAKKR